MSDNVVPLVSIIIPLYNAEKYIGDTIQSVIDQSWPNKELIVVDDGSTDQSLSVAKKFEGDNIKIIVQQNKGASAARNRGLQEAKGGYIQFMDADDLLSVNKIQSQMAELAGHPDDVALCGTIHFMDGTDPLSYSLKHEWLSSGSDDPADFLIKLYGGGIIGPEYGGMVQPNAWLCPKHILDKAGYWNEDLTVDDDGEYFCRVVLAGKGIRYAKDGINYYRKFNNNASWSAQKSYEGFNSLLTSTKLKAKHLLTYTDDQRARKALSRLFWEIAFSFYPAQKKLSREAQKEADRLDNIKNYQPYNSGIKMVLSKIIGWRAVKYLQFLSAEHNDNN